MFPTPGMTVEMQAAFMLGAAYERNRSESALVVHQRAHALALLAQTLQSQPSFSAPTTPIRPGMPPRAARSRSDPDVIPPMTAPPGLEGCMDPQQLPSVGSAGHFEGTCKRCCFYPKGRCENGKECGFCHFEHDKVRRCRAKKGAARGEGEVEVLALQLDHPADEASTEASTAGDEDKLSQPLMSAEPSPTSKTFEPAYSKGSAGHDDGTCKRCCFYPKGRCMNGADCDFCHLLHDKVRRRRRGRTTKEELSLSCLLEAEDPAQAEE
mmetsp:Transcript_2880/g.6526  ORF Transcript_2880/g.6526 Transcript_2880/m.6526 type:complete len:267 (+) Transcript_2880:52-852(+)